MKSESIGLISQLLEQVVAQTTKKTSRQVKVLPQTTPWTVLVFNNHPLQLMTKRMIFHPSRKSLKMREIMHPLKATREVEQLLQAMKTKLKMVVRLLITPILRN